MDIETRLNNIQAVDDVVLSDNKVLDRIYRGRGVKSLDELDYSLKNLANFKALKSVETACDLLLKHKNSQIVIVGDFDVDGASSIAILMRCLPLFGFKKLSYVVPDRFKEGYGLSVAIAHRVLDLKAKLVLTVDNGISSVDGVAFLKSHNIDVIVTDHHLAPEVLPNADAIVNPNQKGCGFISKNLAGVGVSLYLLLALRSKLNQNGFFENNPNVNIANFLDLVALGTVADVVKLDYNNRILVSQGLERIRNGYCSVGIKALCEVSNRKIENISAQDIGFAIAPRLNAAGRLDNMLLGVELLITDDRAKALELAKELNLLNEDRRKIEKSMKSEAVKICENLITGYKKPPKSLVLYQKDWHQGVLGIVSSRLKDEFNCPVITFASETEATPVSDDVINILKGSARSISGLHIRDLLNDIDLKYPHLIIKFGGHAMAAGLSLSEDNLAEFEQAFYEEVKIKLQQIERRNTILTDGELDANLITLDNAKAISKGGPYGQGFEEPCFSGNFLLLSQQVVGFDHLKVRLASLDSSFIFDAINFNFDKKNFPDHSIKKITAVYRMDINEFRGQQNLQLILQQIEPRLN